MSDEAARFVWGGGRFTEDLARSDALHLVVVRSVLPHALITGIEVSEALQRPGVVQVLTADDLDPLPRIPIRVLYTARGVRNLQIIGEKEITAKYGVPGRGYGDFAVLRTSDIESFTLVAAPQASA